MPELHELTERRSDSDRGSTKAIRLALPDVAALLKSADHRAKAGGRSETISQLHEVIRLAPDDAQAQHNAGVALGRLGKPEEAIQCFRRALALRPDYADAHCNLGGVLESPGGSTLDI